MGKRSILLPSPEKGKIRNQRFPRNLGEVPGWSFGEVGIFERAILLGKRYPFDASFPDRLGSYKHPARDRDEGASTVRRSVGALGWLLGHQAVLLESHAAVGAERAACSVKILAICGVAHEVPPA
jgi:hypothetical protein